MALYAGVRVLSDNVSGGFVASGDISGRFLECPCSQAIVRNDAGGGGRLRGGGGNGEGGGGGKQIKGSREGAQDRYVNVISLSLRGYQPYRMGNVKKYYRRVLGAAPSDISAKYARRTYIYPNTVALLMLLL